MATIERYTARQGLNPGSAPSTPVSGALGEAIQGIGGALSVMEERKQQKDAFKAETAAKKLELELGEDLQLYQENMAEDGAGFHDDFIQNVYRPKRDAFLQTVPENMRERFAAQIGEDSPGAEAWSIRAAEVERNATYAWAESEVSATQEQLATAISIEPERYDEMLQAGFDQIESAPVPTATRTKLRQQWEEMAQVAHLNRLLEEDPESVIKQLGADPRYLSPTTQYDLLKKAVIGQESNGNPDAVSPKGAIGLMQVMPGTARDIAKEIGDTNFPTGGDPVQVSEYLSRPGINQRYGDHYLKKQLRDFNGDVEAALIAYNGGPQRAKAWLKADRDDSVIPKESADYYKKVIDRMGIGGQAAKGSPEAATFTWVRDGGNEKLAAGDKRLEAVNKDLRDRVATAFTAAGVNNIKIRSGHRDHERNDAAGGAKNSEHLRGNALDIDVAGMPIAKRLEIIRSLSANGVTGIGVYANTIHADVGSRRAWGPSYGRDSVPKWAEGAIAEHVANTAKAPGVAGRYASLSYDKRQQFIANADRVVTQRYTDQQKATAVQKVEVRRAMDNELASIAATGQTTGFDDTAVASVLGEDDYLKWVASKDKTQRVYTAKQGIATMSPEEMETRLTDFTARPGSANFAAEAEVQAAVEKEIDRVTRLRSTAPDKAAMEFPEIKASYEEVQASLASGQPDAEAVQSFVKLMLERQAEFNIAPETRAPIPKDWALQIGQSLSRVPEPAGRNMADVRANIAVQYMALQEFFGEYTEEVIIHSLSEYKGISKNTGELITSYMQAIEAGGDPLRLDKNRVMDQDHVESNNGRGWFQSVTDWFTGEDEPGENAPEAVTEDVPSPEVLRRIQSQMSPDDGPAEEAMLIERYGQRAVDAAKAGMSQ